jgi:(R,R)-butanediol dehydrogenase/meso-butanediol dehydrogenase/diacetyl reductase
MKAARYHIGEEGMLQIDDVPLPEPEMGEVRIKVAYSGICGSDLGRYRQLPHPPQSLRDQLGKISNIPGHEFSGIIDQAGPGIQNTWEDGSSVLGSRVVVHPLVGCGLCPACQDGNWSACEVPEKIQLIGLQRNGGLAEWVTVPFDHLVRISNDALPLQTATLTEPLSVAVHATELAGMEDPEVSVAILGDGAIGILAAHLLVRKGFKDVLLVGHHSERLQVARQMGVENSQLSQAIDESYHWRFPYVIQLAGSQEALEMGMRLMARGGLMICLGYLHPPHTGLHPDLYFQLIRYEKALKGSYVYTYDQFHRALDMISSGFVRVEPLISTIVPFEDVVAQGFEPLVGTIKPPGKVLAKMA